MKHTLLEISAFELKILAIVAMTCNHIANVFGSHMPNGIAFAFYSVGGMTFPIMTFLVSEGYSHTSNLRRYAMRLGTFAIISQIPYSLVWGASPNVLFTLLVGLGLLYADEHIASRLGFGCVFIAAVLLTTPFDWGAVGIVVMYCFKQWRHASYGPLFVTFIPVAVIGLPALLSFVSGVGGFDALCDIGYCAIGCVSAGMLLTCYNGLRGKNLKWLFYCYYPAHLFIIWLAALFTISA